MSDEFGNFNADVSFGADFSASSHSCAHHGVPSPDALRQFDYIVFGGTFANGSQATQLGGATRLAVEDGAFALCLYPVRLEGAYQVLMSELLALGQVTLNTDHRVQEADSAFYDYFGAYGRSGVYFETLPDDAQIIGDIEQGPVALICQLGEGHVGLIPYHVANFQVSHNDLIRSVLTGIRTYQTAQGDSPPPAFLDALRLPGEVEAEQEITRLVSQLADQRREASRLARYRLLMSALSGDRLEALVIDSLNLILGRTQLRAEDRDEERVEDFWLVDDEGDRALAEAKGIGSNVRRQDVNQVENHRAERDRAVEDLPGLLVVNTFRNSDDLDKRLLPVSDDVVRHAARLNVLILRTVDLLGLLRLHLGGTAVGATFGKALASGGGWLECDGQTATMRKP